jgi:hypothetical protein
MKILRIVTNTLQQLLYNCRYKNDRMIALDVVS